MGDIAQGKNATHQFPELKADKNEFPDDEELLEEEHRLGNYEVIEQIYKYIPEARQGKAHLDHVIDICGTPKEGGTGLQNLRDQRKIQDPAAATLHLPSGAAGA